MQDVIIQLISFQLFTVSLILLAVATIAEFIKIRKELQECQVGKETKKPII